MPFNFIVTNLRVDKQDWNQVRAIAGEQGISANQYVTLLIRKLIARRELGVETVYKEDKMKLPVWELHKLAKEARPMKSGISAEDAIVYET